MKLNLDLDNLFPKSPLHDAASMGDLETVKKLLAEGADINSKDALGGMTPLYKAIGQFGRGFEEWQERMEKIQQSADEPKDPWDALQKFDFKKIAKEMWQRPHAVEPSRPDDLEMVRFLLEHGADVNATTDDGRTALMAAAEGGQTETVGLLLDWGADTHPQDRKGDNALMKAAEAQRLEVVKLLLERGADAEQRTPNGATLLMTAARGGSIEIARLLVERGAAVNVTTETGNSALLQSILSNHPTVQDYLRSVGAIVGILELLGMGDMEQANVLPLPADRSSAWGFGILDWAVRYEKPDVLQFLVDKGIRFAPNDERGQKVMQRAMFLGNKDTVRLLQEMGLPLNRVLPSPHASRLDIKPTSNLSMAVSQGNVELARMLIEQGADVNETDSRLSLLVTAVTFGNIEMVTLLLDAGANVNGTPDDVMPPLMMAVQKNDEAIVKLLLERGANPKDRNAKIPIIGIAQNSPLLPLLQNAIKDDYFELATAGKTAELLAQIDDGTDIHAADDLDRTALHLAARNGHLETVRALLERGANVNLPGLANMTPLLDAIVGKHSDIVNLLVEHGASVNQQNWMGVPPLLSALMGKSNDIAERLIDAGATVGIVEAAFLGDLETVRWFLRDGKSVAETVAGFTPLMAAAAGGHQEVAEFLLMQGADINAAYPNGGTAVGYAAAHNHPALVNWLLDRGADIHGYGKGQRLDLGRNKRRRETEDPEVLAYVEAEKAKFEARMRGAVPLEMAAQAPGEDMARLLLDRGANPNGTEELFDMSPLVSAILAGRADLVRLFLERGADPNRKHPEGMSLLEWAANAPKATPEIKKMLRDAMQSKS